MNVCKLLCITSGMCVWWWWWKWWCDDDYRRVYKHGWTLLLFPSSSTCDNLQRHNCMEFYVGHLPHRICNRMWAGLLFLGGKRGGKKKLTYYFLFKLIKQTSSPRWIRRFAMIKILFSLSIWTHSVTQFGSHEWLT